MTYVTLADVESFAGYTNTDFRSGDQFMTPEQWTAFVESLISGVEGAIHRFCRVSSFAISTYTEYHNGRGMSGDRGRNGYRGQLFTELDRTFFPREQPVESILHVAEDIGYPGPVNYVNRVVRDGSSSDWDYQIVPGVITAIRFLNNVPRKGIGNVRLEYTAGYDEDSQELSDIRLIELETIANYLARKKRDQEAQAARREPTRDAAEMFKELRPDILTKEIKSRLAPYQRNRTGTRMWA